jgi:HlyD family secretion protein
VGGYYAWRSYLAPELPDGFASSNGRIEATEIDVAIKIAGRVEDIMADEGDFVEAGQVLARMDTAVLEAQLHEAEAQLACARVAVGGRAAAEAVVAQREAEAEAARRRLARTEELAFTGSGYIQSIVRCGSSSASTGPMRRPHGSIRS